MKMTQLAILSVVFCAAVVAQASSDASLKDDSHSAVTQSDSATQTQPSLTGAAFMEANAKKPGVVTLPSGLQYEILEPGHGAKPTKNSTVTVHYEGKLLNGTTFDSSYQRDQPATFPVSGVIAGWQEALPLMSEGATWMLYIPPQLAYGQTGAGGLIGPNETLIFKVHLIRIQ